MCPALHNGSNTELKWKLIIFRFPRKKSDFWNKIAKISNFWKLMDHLI